MTTFKKGDAVWLYWNQSSTDYPQLHHRPGIITKRRHPTSFMVAFCRDDRPRNVPVGKWKLDRRSHEHHPTDLHPYDLDPGMELRRRRTAWKEEASQEKQEAKRKEDASNARLQENLNRIMGPILGRMLRG